MQYWTYIKYSHQVLIQFEGFTNVCVYSSLQWYSDFTIITIVRNSITDILILLK